MRYHALLTALLMGGLTACTTLSTPTAATAPAASTGPQRSTDEILKSTTAADWRTVSPENLMLMDVAGKTVMIELAPSFAPAHVANIRTLTRNGYWDGLAILRSHENYVVQWGDPNDEDPKLKRSTGTVNNQIPAEYERPLQGLDFKALPDVDGWARLGGFSEGFAAASDGQSAWLTHCYGAVGVGRGNPPDSGDGSSLYVVIGQAPRNLDRNITVVGRVLSGMEVLTPLPRGTGPLGFYEKAEQRAPLTRVRLAAADPSAPRLQVLRTDSAAFAELTENRRNRRDTWYVRPAGYTNICNVTVPFRTAPTN